MNTCEQAMAVIADMKSDRESAEETSVLAHLVTCRACLSRLDQLARASLSTAPVELSCAESRDRMPNLRAVLAEAKEPLATAQTLLDAEVVTPIDGEELPALARLAALLAHLRRCPDCNAEMRALDDVLALHETGALAPAPAGLALDLGFLRTEPEAVVHPSIWQDVSEKAGQGARRLSDAIRLVIRDGNARFGELASALEPTPITAAAFRGDEEGAGEQVGERLVVPDSDADLSIQLSIGPAQNDRAIIALTLSRSEGAQPVSNTRVLLYDEASRLLAGEMTSSEGSATFQDLVVGAYRLEVRLDANRWQLPFVVSEG